MDFDILEIATGLSVDDAFHFVPYSGAGAGGTTLSDAAPVTSLAVGPSGIQFKEQGGAGTDKWEFLATKDYVDAKLSNQPWRDPACIKDSAAYADLAAAEAAVNTGALQGYSLNDGERILFDNISGVNKNVYIINGTPGSGATLVEDTNTATKGDVISITHGDEAGSQWGYNGTDWVLTRQDSGTEIGFLNAFIGKDSAGSELPAYISQNYIGDGDTLELAIGKTDQQLGVVNTQIANINTSQGTVQGEIDAIEAGAGLGSDGTFTADAASNYGTGATSLFNWSQLLDTFLKETVDSLNLGLGLIGGIQTELDNSQAGAGLAADGSYIQPTGSNYLDATTSGANAVLALDAAANTNAGNITALQTVNSNQQTEIDLIETGAGLAADGSFAADAGSNYGTGATSLFNWSQLLDIQAKANADAITTLQTDSGDEPDIRAFIGKDAAGAEVPAYPSALVVTQGADLETAIGEMDPIVDRAWHRTESANVTTQQVIDAVLCREAIAVHWLVRVQETATQDTRFVYVVASHNGNATQDATARRRNLMLRQRMGNVEGMDVDVELNGSGATQALELRVGANNTSTVVAARRILI